MKKILLLIASAALLFVGCAKEQVGPGAAADGDMVDVNFTAGTVEHSKALIDEDGEADCVTRWIMEVRDASGAIYARKEGTESAGTLQHTFDIKLFKNQQYTFAFWADNGGEYYDASDLSAVKYADGKAVVAGVDAKDAFSAVETLVLTESISKTITLYRPFAQLNVITNDLAALKADAISADAYNAFKPKNFKTTITVPTQFNVLTGAASEETELILSADEFYGKTPVSYEDAPEQATMFMAYIFATKDEKDIRNVSFKFDVDSQTGNNAFAINDVPFQRNYRTNILGNFLSGDVEWHVIISPDWDGEYDFPPYEAGSIAAANASLAAGETNISITDPSDYTDVSLVIPAAVNDKDLIIAVAEKADMELDIDASYSTPKTISLSVVKAKSLNIDAPATHVELTAGEYTDDVIARTSATTLVVGKNTKINTLEITKGNAVIDGTVTNFVNATGATLVWNVANTAELANAFKFAGQNDEIKLAAGNYTMPADEVKTSGLKITGEGGTVIDCPATRKISASGIVLKDLTVKCNPSNGSDSGTWNITKKATLENITFTENSTKIVVVSGSEQVDFKACRFENKGKGRAIMVWNGSPVINVDGCYFDNVYPFNVDGGSPVFTVKNSQLNGWTSYTKTATVSFENCDFGTSTSGYAYCRPYSSTTFTSCNFCKGYLMDFGAENIEIALNGCKLGGQPVTVDILDLEALSCSGKLMIDGVQVYPFYTKDADGNYHVANAIGLFAIAKDIKASVSKFYYKTIFLDADIDLKNEAWTPIQGGMSGDFDFDFDGQNHEIKNIAIDANGSKNAAFIGNWAGDIKNLTLNTITVTNGDKRTAGLVGQMATGTIENCHVINANIQSSNYKVGGLVGSVTADPCTIKNCSVKNSSIEGLEQVGGFCGSLGTGDGGATRFIDNVVENITITSSNSAIAKANTFGAYVGTYFVDGYVAENTNNTVSGTNDIYSANEGFGILLQQ